MVTVNDWKSPILTEAVLIWTGWGREIMPSRDDSLVVSRFGAKTASELLPIVKSMADEFDASDAKYAAPDLAEMGRMAGDDFRRKHPEVAEEIVRALAWCYTFDYK
jgi:hypothetical protein